MGTLLLADLLDEWLQKGDDAGEPLLWLADYLDDERVTRLGDLCAIGLLDQLQSAAPRIATTFSSLLDLTPEAHDREAAAARYEDDYGGVGLGEAGYTRAIDAFDLLERLRDQLASLGETDTALQLYYMMLGLAELPSWGAAQRTHALSVFEKVERDEWPNWHDCQDATFLMNYPLAKLLHLFPDVERFEAWLETYLDQEGYWQQYDFAYRRHLATLKPRLLAAPDAMPLDVPLDHNPISPQMYVEFADELCRKACRRETIAFYRKLTQATSFAGTGTDDDDGTSVIGLILQQCQGHDPMFVEVLDTAIHSEAFANSAAMNAMTEEWRAGLAQLVEALKLAADLAEQQLPRAQIRARILENSSALEYWYSVSHLHSVELVRVADEASSTVHAQAPLRLVAQLASCPRPDTLAEFITIHAGEFDEEFFYALRHEHDAIQRMAQTAGSEWEADLERLLRRGQLIAKLVSQDAPTAAVVDAAQLQLECAMEALLHAALANWTLYRRCEVICAAIPMMSATLADTMLQRARTANAREREALMQAASLVHQVAARRESRQSLDELQRQMQITLADHEAKDEYQMLGSADGPATLWHLWRLGAVSHADNERHYADEVQILHAAREADFGARRLPETVWGEYCEYFKASHADEAGLLDFIARHSRVAAIDTETVYLHAYLHTTRAMLHLAHDEDPTGALANGLGLAARAGVFPVIALVVPCWLAAAHYATAHRFEYDAFLQGVGRHAPRVTNPVAEFLLTKFLPAFGTLESLSRSRVDHAAGQQFLEELAAVETQYGQLNAAWSLHAWAEYWLVKQGRRSL